MDQCRRIIESPAGALGVVKIQKCGCSTCSNRKAATEAFYQKFDLLYQQYNLNKDLNVSFLDKSQASGGMENV